MVRTKMTARKSSGGGRGPRKQLATYSATEMAAELAAEARIAGATACKWADLQPPRAYAATAEPGLTFRQSDAFGTLVRTGMLPGRWRCAIPGTATAAAPLVQPSGPPKWDGINNQVLFQCVEDVLDPTDRPSDWSVDGRDVFNVDVLEFGRGTNLRESPEHPDGSLIGVYVDYSSGAIGPKLLYGPEEAQETIITWILYANPRAQFESPVPDIVSLARCGRGHPAWQRDDAPSYMVLATRYITAGTVIGRYAGKVELGASGGTDRCFDLVPGSMFIDAEDTCNETSFINDYRTDVEAYDDPSKQDLGGPNCKAVGCWFFGEPHPMILIVARTLIQSGQELTLDYGNSYWAATVEQRRQKLLPGESEDAVKVAASPAQPQEMITIGDDEADKDEAPPEPAAAATQPRAGRSAKAMQRAPRGHMASEIATRISRPRSAKRQRSNDEDVVVVPPPPSPRPVVIALLSSSDEEEAGAAAAPKEDPPPPGAAAARTASVVRVKEERDGGWPAEFQVIREQPFDEADYTELRAWFCTEIDVIAGGRESQTRQGTLRVTQRVTGRTVRIAEWPQLRDRVQQMHEAGQHEQALQHLRCLKRYLQLVQHKAMPRVLRVSGSSTGFAEGEVVDLTTGGQEPQRLEIDVDTVQGLILQNLAASSLEGALVKVKAEVNKEDTLSHPMQEGRTMTQVVMVPPGQAKKLEESRQEESMQAAALL